MVWDCCFGLRALGFHILDLAFSLVFRVYEFRGLGFGVQGLGVGYVAVCWFCGCRTQQGSLGFGIQH